MLGNLPKQTEERHKYVYLSICIYISIYEPYLHIERRVDHRGGAGAEASQNRQRRGEVRDIGRSVYLYIDLYLYLYLYLYMYLYPYLYRYLSIYLYLYIYISISLYLSIDLYLSIYMCIYIYISIYV